ncbi:MAG: hypothetical protein ABW168_24375 [Sedimenticola sp.]
MINDPIVEEVRRFRREHAAKYKNDLDRIVDALQKKEKCSNKPRLNPGPRLHLMKTGS